MRYEIRPLGRWTGPLTVDRARSARFRAPWDDTLKLLGREVDLLDGDLIVVQVDADPSEIRRDGMLRHHARVGFPGVRISFTSRHGPLTYATDAYDRWMGSDPPGWQANVRAIALALEALRAVDRYGVTHTGEQYRGWTAIEAQPSVMTADEAARVLAGYASGFDAATILSSAAVRTAAYRIAARRTHPDAGGAAADFHRVTEARDVLARANGAS